MLVSKSKKPLHLNMRKRIQIFPKDKKQRLALTKWLRENNIQFEEHESAFNPELVEKILAGKKSIEDGNFISYSPDVLWK